MFETLMITFREGLEAFLIIAITTAYLIKTGGQHLVPYVKYACYVAIALCAALGIKLAEIGGLTPFWEGMLAFIAAILVISCTVHMLRMGKHMKKEITGAIDKASASGSAKVGIFGFVLLMMGREGVEAATMIASVSQRANSMHLVIGGILGLLLAGAVAWAWSKYGHRINLSLFFKVTAVFMILFSLQLLIYAFHEFTESPELYRLGILDVNYWHQATEAYGPEGQFGHWLTYSLVLLPLGFLIHGLIQKPTQAAR